MQWKSRPIPRFVLANAEGTEIATVELSGDGGPHAPWMWSCQIPDFEFGYADTKAEAQRAVLDWMQNGKPRVFDEEMSE